MNTDRVKSKFKSLLIQLSSDPNVAAAITAFRTKGAEQNAALGFKVLILQVLRLSSKFLGKRKARYIEEWIDILSFLVAISLILKENVFDRPEVKEFFEKGWGDFKSVAVRYYKLASKYVTQAL